MKEMLFLLCCVVGVTLVACNGSAKPAEEAASEPAEAQAQLQSEVMAIHDEVMPEMGRINQLSRTLREYLEENPDLTEERRTALFEAVAALDRADEGMMDWMAAYGGLVKNFETMEPQQIMEALEGEKKKISEVRDQMLSSIEMGERYVAEIEGAEE